MEDILSSTQELAAVGQEGQVAEKVETKVIHVKEEYWDGVSTLVTGKWYRFRSTEEVERAFKNMPEMLASFRKFSEAMKESPKDESPVLLKEKDPFPLREKDMEVPLDYPLGAELKTLFEEAAEKDSKIKGKAEENPKLAADEWFAYSSASASFSGYTQYPNQVRAIIHTSTTVHWQIPNAYIWKVSYEMDYLAYRDYAGWSLGNESWATYMQGSHAFSYDWHVVFERNVTVGIQGGFYTSPPYSLDWENHSSQTCTVSGVGKGDCDLNNLWDIFDVLRILDFIALDPAPQVGPQQWAADVEDDGDCDSYDLVALLEILNVYAGYPPHPILSGAAETGTGKDYSELYGRIRSVLMRRAYTLDTEGIAEIRGIIHEYLDKK